MHLHFQEYFAETIRKLEKPGLLLVSANRQGKSNVMTIGWGLIGVFWGKPVFTISVRSSSYTRELIEDSGEFTVNVPEESMNDIVQHCGEVSGREHDKFSECKLSLLQSRFVRPPIIKQCKLHYECRVVQRTDIIPRLVPVKFFIRVMTTKLKEIFHNRGNYRSLYFGEILAVY
jgi:flavin reductase (DIM6/NTAB) family NADH-FMN oxidoreductase RutF